MTKPLRLRRRAALRASLAIGIASALPATAVRAQSRRRTAEGPPLANSPQEKRILAVLEDVYRNHRYLSVPEEDGRLLRVLTEALDAKHVVEIGTSTGYSGLWILLALATTGGRLTTYEIDPVRHEQARRFFEQAGVSQHAVLVLGDAHVEVTKLKGPIDVVFIDADKEGYPAYLKALAPRVRPGGLIIAHNVASPPPDPRYIEAVTSNPAFETVFLNMHSAGVGLTLKKR